jgi:FtsP/CotA-like multicopper oxidase with cupredoxin domain
MNNRYRFRLINMSCLPNYVFSIDGHNLTVIEADGVTHQPVVVDSIQIYAGMFISCYKFDLLNVSFCFSIQGQRYSFIVRD